MAQQPAIKLFKLSISHTSYALRSRKHEKYKQFFESFQLSLKWQLYFATFLLELNTRYVMVEYNEIKG